MNMKTPTPGAVEKHRSTDPFAAVSCPALRTALREVSAEWTPGGAWGCGDQTSMDHTLLRLALRLDGIDDPRVLPEVDGRRLTHDPRVEGRLLEAIRRDLLEQWRRRELPVDEERVLELLHEIELHAKEFVVEEEEDPEAGLAGAGAFQVVAEVVHDLRSPLTSILFLSEAMRDGRSGSLTELQERQLGLVYSAALGLMGVVNDVLTEAQARTSGQHEEALAFSLPQTFESVHEMVAPLAEAKEVALRFGVHCFGHRIGHPGPLGRVLLNLTTNAIKFTEEGGLVEVLAESVARDAVMISVSDTGRGITPEQLAQLFEPFQKSRGREGFFFAPSGLGLSIVRRLLKQMDSELTVESEVGEGTRFSFVLVLPTAQ
jgi:signal transduction histidine kinase